MIKMVIVKLALKNHEFHNCFLAGKDKIEAIVKMTKAKKRKNW